MAWRYCSKCEAGQDQITFQETKDYTLYDVPVTCFHCGHPREDCDEDNIKETIFKKLDEIDDRLRDLEIKI